jgi:hypothetical protein
MDNFAPLDLTSMKALIPSRCLVFGFALVPILLSELAVLRPLPKWVDFEEVWLPHLRTSC